ncbi:MAG: asparagine synthase (glutamine-hydrolyzing) [Acidobacteriota bacterium]
MCGICGELSFDRRPVSPEAVRSMRDQLVHRGPDAFGIHVSADGLAGLGFRRLKIIDLSPNANQPMANEDGSIQLVFNGEIYNFRAIRERLVAAGHQFRSRSDTEVIVHLYEEKGEDCVEDLDGMFALALWDARRRRLVLARDRVGKKPLFVYRDERRLAFASEIKAFLAHPEIELVVNEPVLPYYFLYGYVPAPETFYRSVTQVDPGTVVTVTADAAITHRVYWKPRFPPASRPSGPAIDRRQATATVRSLTTQAVERRLVSDVPLGAFLSGGVDSTIVVGLMAGLTREPVKTFSIGFEGDAAYDETAHAREVAERFRTDHTEFRVSPSAVGLIDTLLWHHDGPFGDSSAIPTYLVSQLTRQHVTVVLTGDGGDEVFAGYLRFHAALTAGALPPWSGRMLSALLSPLPAPPNERHFLSRARRFARYMHRPLLERLTRWNSFFGEDLESLLAPRFRRAPTGIDPLFHLRRDLDDLRQISPLSQLLLANFRSYLPGDLLVKTDRMTMASGIEARSPFLDRALIDYVATLPDTWKLSRRGQTKVILREAFADLIPERINRRAKMGFGVPLDRWFRGELRDYVRDTLMASDARCHAYLDRSAVEAIVGRHERGEANLGQQLWCLLAFERWLRLLPEWRRTGRRSPRAVASEART